jgi:hypothetical protein
VGAGHAARPTPPPPLPPHRWTADAWWTLRQGGAGEGEGVVYSTALRAQKRTAEPAQSVVREAFKKHAAGWLARRRAACTICHLVDAAVPTLANPTITSTRHIPTRTTPSYTSALPAARFRPFVRSPRRRGKSATRQPFPFPPPPPHNHSITICACRERSDATQTRCQPTRPPRCRLVAGELVSRRAAWRRCGPWRIAHPAARSPRSPPGDEWNALRQWHGGRRGGEGALALQGSV